MGIATFITADLHLGHAGVCKFLRDDGTKLRPWDSPDQMDEALIGLWNARVRPTDRVYVLGDVVINRRCLPTVGRLNGEKVLIKGNHDVFRIEEYARYFRDVRACHVFDGMILTHIPVHPAQLDRFGVNVHGHMHDKALDDPRYVCVSIERTGFAPITIEELRSMVADNPVGDGD